MKTWTLSSEGVLSVTDETGLIPVTAEEVYASIVEKTPTLEGMPVGKQGDASELQFSRYPVNASLVLDTSDCGLPYIRLEARTQLDQTFPLSYPAMLQGHVVHRSTWHPISDADKVAIAALINNLDLSTDTAELTSLKQCLLLKRAAISGEPVVDQLDDDTLSTLSTFDSNAKPVGITGDLYAYQIRGWQWLKFIIAQQAGGLLADEMGLGKTLQVISALSDHDSTTNTLRYLVVAPGSLLENWIREVRKFCPGLQATKHHGPDRTGSPAELGLSELVLTSYETVVRDLSLLRMIRWQVVVLDEAQNIRNPQTRRAEAVKKLRREVSIAVTGTPFENRLRDLWSILDFVLPGYLDELSTFENRFTENDGDASLLEPLVSPVILRRRITEVAKDLPPRIDVPEILELDDAEMLAYENIRKAIHREYANTANFVSLTRLRQFCAHPALLSEHPQFQDYTKFERLKTLLTEVFEMREKVLVFTSFIGMADRIANMVSDEFGVLSATIDGRLPMPDRQSLIDKFSAYQGPAVLILNPKVGGAGLNIAAANHVIQYNPEWNPAVEDQAVGRVYRRGQTRPVTIRRLIVSNTVEEVMDERLQRKRDIAGSAVVATHEDRDDYREVMDALTRSPLKSAP